jgi:hypothetical protein
LRFPFRFAECALRLLRAMRRLRMAVLDVHMIGRLSAAMPH